MTEPDIPTDVVERVAQAIHEATSASGLFPWDEEGGVHREQFRRMARAVIDALGHQRTIDTVEQLDALPVRTLIGYGDSPRIFRRYWTPDDGDSEHFWQEPGGSSYRSREIPLPCRVLWHPDDG